MRLSDFIGETTEYDKKERLEERRPKSWLKSVSSFANGIGGILFFGISDDEVLIGLDDAKGVSEKISEARIYCFESAFRSGDSLLLYW